MLYPFLGGRWPKRCIRNDSGAGVIAANGRTPMDKAATFENEHIPWGACERALLAIRGQQLLESVAEVIVATLASLPRLGVKLVAVGPNIEGPLRECEYALHAPRVFLIPMRGCCCRSSALWGSPNCFFYEMGDINLL